MKIFDASELTVEELRPRVKELVAKNYTHACTKDGYLVAVVRADETMIKEFVEHVEKHDGAFLLNTYIND